MRVGPDVLCLQEIDESSMSDWLVPQLGARGYTGIHMKKPSHASKDGVAVFYKGGKAQLVHAESSPISAKGSNQVAIVAVFAVSGIPVAVACTHLKATKDEATETLRLKQVVAVLDRLAAAADKFSSRHALLCTDMNARPDDGGYRPLAYGATWAHSLSRCN